jgi:hypothetical protein
MTPSRATRRTVRDRAGGCCEYCRLPENDMTPTFHVDHVLPIKHGGTDALDNLCLACMKCNAHKGHDLSGLDPMTGNLTRLFNPCLQLWDDHFLIQDDVKIIGKTPEGRVTVQLLQMNSEERIQTRQILVELELYPC